MNLEKKYYDEDENEINILQLVKKSPEWAANRIQEGEKALEHVITLSRCLAEACNLIPCNHDDCPRNDCSVCNYDCTPYQWCKALADINNGKTWQQILEEEAGNE